MIRCSPPTDSRLLNNQTSRFGTSIWCVTLMVIFSLLQGCEAQTEHQDLKESREVTHSYEVIIERDIRGVPHIIGKNDADAAFGLAYAQAEDHWQLIESAIPFYRGTKAKYVGQESAVTDYLVKWFDIWGTINSQYETQLSPDSRAYLEAFADGINYYAAKHSEKITTDVLPVSGKDLVAGYMIQHLLFYGLDSTLQELNAPTRQREISKSGGVHVGGLPVGSNAFAVSPIYADDGATRIAINSHQPATGPVAWYEAHIRSGEGLDIMGGLFPASPTIGVGFNRHLAWGATVNKPDLVDVFLLEIHPEDEMLYNVDGEWLSLERREVYLEVKLFGFLRWKFEREAFQSIHGPVLRTDHGTYAVRYAGMGEIRQVEQWMAMAKAQNLSQWREAMKLHRFASFNFVAADSDGNIMFVHNSMTPVRAAGFDWSQYLPGNKREIIWDSYLPFDSLPQLFNPASGYILSANQSPFRVTSDPYNPDPTRYRAENGFPTRMTNRADRGLELLEALGPISESEFSAIKHDKSYSPNSRAGRFISKTISQVLGKDTPVRYKKAQEHLAKWNLSTDLENRGAALGTCIIGGEWLAEQAGDPPPDHISELKRCTDVLLDATGKIGPRWGDINRHIRGQFNLSVAGGPDTLRAIYGLGLEDDGFLTNVAGDGLYYLISWDDKKQQTIRGIHQFGSATLDENSPHFDDQTLDYVNEKLHDPLFDDSRRKNKILRRYRP